MLDEIAFFTTPGKIDCMKDHSRYLLDNLVLEMIFFVFLTNFIVRACD